MPRSTSEAGRVIESSSFNKFQLAPVVLLFWKSLVRESDTIKGEADGKFCEYGIGMQTVEEPEIPAHEQV